MNRIQLGTNINIDWCTMASLEGYIPAGILPHSTGEVTIISFFKDCGKGIDDLDIITVVWGEKTLRLHRKDIHLPIADNEYKREIETLKEKYRLLELKYNTNIAGYNTEVNRLNQKIHAIKEVLMR